MMANGELDALKPQALEEARPNALEGVLKERA